MGEHPWPGVQRPGATGVSRLHLKGGPVPPSMDPSIPPPPSTFSRLHLHSPAFAVLPGTPSATSTSTHNFSALPSPVTLRSSLPSSFHCRHGYLREATAHEVEYSACDETTSTTKGIVAVGPHFFHHRQSRRLRLTDATGTFTNAFAGGSENFTVHELRGGFTIAFRL
ncbi:hypothetical protein Purlil1_6122 [Purpureocillium lilacinum]|uniref:CVNH domain-containing protein n=1 Tax=Purpureocillium lilacinum TaxID=33203 RepID=A0ABR0C1F2_PURLI|nr:hypothetical protein Purlil1_6122 [Purpureocillium lilacinum]